jgi:hypothetical protein
MRVAALRDGVEQHLVVKQRPAGLSASGVGGRPVSWSFPISTEGLSVSQAEDGTIEFRDTSGSSGASGPVVSRLTAPAAWDSTVPAGQGGPIGFGAVALSLRQQSPNKVLVTVTPDPAWLADPARVFPVVVDPTYLSVVPSTVFDTYVQSGLTTAQSGSTELRLGTPDAGTTVARSFLTFDTSAIAGKKITAASLSLYERWSASCQSRGWELWGAGRANSTTVWSTAPAVSPKYATSIETKGYSSNCVAGRGGWASMRRRSRRTRPTTPGHRRVRRCGRPVRPTRTGGRSSTPPRPRRRR